MRCQDCKTCLSAIKKGHIVSLAAGIVERERIERRQEIKTLLINLHI